MQPQHSERQAATALALSREASGVPPLLGPHSAQVAAGQAPNRPCRGEQSDRRQQRIDGARARVARAFGGHENGRPFRGGQGWDVGRG
jgi:hypothetical protein